MLTTYEADRLLKREWRLQVMKRRRDPRWIRARKGLAALCIYERGKLSFPYVELKHLRLALVYEDEFCCDGVQASDRTPLRFCGYRASCSEHEIQWGGVDNSTFFKDLTLAPHYLGCGQRIDLAKPDLLRLAVEADRSLVDAASNPERVRPQLQLPRLWAGYRSSRASNVRGVGSEFEQACLDQSISASLLMKQCQRNFEGLKLFPLEYVGAELKFATTVLAQMDGFPNQQTFQVPEFPTGLIGYTGVTAFDFYHSRYRRTPISPRSAAMDFVAS